VGPGIDCLVLLLIAVPRHPEQFESIKSQSSEMQMNYINRSHAQMPDETTQLIIGDTMGELTLLCGAADIAFLGGSMINRGGHNPLEPAACGIPIIMGNSIYNFLDVSKIMIESDCLTLVNDEVELVSSISTLLNDKNRLSQQQQMTKNLFKENGQTVNKLSKLIDEYLE
jgi:3-deoxy-D-manno-octulosonic-acid transferase